MTVQITWMTGGDNGHYTKTREIKVFDKRTYLEFIKDTIRDGFTDPEDTTVHIMPSAILQIRAINV